MCFSWWSKGNIIASLVIDYEVSEWSCCLKSWSTLFVGLLPAIGFGLMWPHTYEENISSSLLCEYCECYLCCLGNLSYLQLVNWVFWSLKYWWVEQFAGCRRYKAVEAWSMFWMWWILMSFYTRNSHTLSQGLRDSCSEFPYSYTRGPILCILVIICLFII